MNYLWQEFCESLSILWALDSEVLGAAARSLWISSLAVCLAGLIGIPLGRLLARRKFFGRRLFIHLARAGMAFPTVFIGIVCFAVLSRRGPLGPMELLYTPWAIVIGEFFLALPIIVSLSHGAIRALDSRVEETSRMLGANRVQRWITDVSEARTGITLALLTAFARCVTELGVAMMVGGNIKDRTRTLATSTAMETGKGEFAQGLAMGILLLVIALTIVLIVGTLNREEE